jgi:hypothetical protein
MHLVTIVIEHHNKKNYLVYWYPNEEFVKFWKWIDWTVWYIQLTEKKNLIDLPYLDDHSFYFWSIFSFSHFVSIFSIYFKWYKVPTMLLEKVSIHTEILFVHCYKFFLLLLVLFLCLSNVTVYTCITFHFFALALGEKGVFYSYKTSFVSIVVYLTCTIML